MTETSRPELPEDLWPHLCRVANYPNFSLPDRFDSATVPDDETLCSAISAVAHRASRGVHDLSLPANLDAVTAWNSLPIELLQYLEPLMRSRASAP